jgi:hypothetical protein
MMYLEIVSEKLTMIKEERRVDAMDDLRWTLCRQIHQEAVETYQSLWEILEKKEVDEVVRLLRRVLNGYWRVQMESGVVYDLEEEIQFEYLRTFCLSKWVMENWENLESWSGFMEKANQRGMYTTRDDGDENWTDIDEEMNEADSVDSIERESF